MRYIHIYEDDLVSMGIFLLPQGARLPLHDHPEMLVLSHLLFGDLYVESYSWEESDTMTAVLEQSDQLTGPTMLTLNAEERNLHDLEAVSEHGCAFFDVLCPPYGDTRECTYYRVEKDLPSTDPMVTRVELEAIEQPRELIITHSPYEGQQVDHEAIEY